MSSRAAFAQDALAAASDAIDHLYGELRDKHLLAANTP